MLSSRGSGKYLSNRWHRDRDSAMRGTGTSGEYSQAELELSDYDVGGRYFKETFEIETHPIDPITEPKTRDIRDNPKRGGLE